MRKYLLVVGAVLALTGALWAQAPTQDTTSGNECWNAGQGPGGPSNWLCINLVRNSTAKIVTALTGGNFTIGGTAATAAIADGGAILVTTQPSPAANITLPANPVPDGAIIAYCNVSNGAFATNVVSFVANTGQTIATSFQMTTQAAGSCTKVQFNRATTTWYRIQ